MILATYILMSATEATLKVISATSKMILATEEDTAPFKVIAAATKMILATEKSNHSHFKRCLIHYKVIFATEEVTTTTGTLKVISATKNCSWPLRKSSQPL